MAASACCGLTGLPAGAPAEPRTHLGVEPASVGNAGMAATEDITIQLDDTAADVQSGVQAGGRRGSSSSGSQLLRSASRLPGGMMASTGSAGRSREELVEEGVPAQQAEQMIVRENMTEALMAKFMVAIGCIACIICLMLPAAIILYVAFLISLAFYSEGCEGPLKSWGLVFAIWCILFNPIKRTTENSDLCQRCPTTWKVIECMIPFCLICAGLYFVYADDPNSPKSCQVHAPMYYALAKAYCIFTFVYLVIMYTGIGGMLAFAMWCVRNGWVPPGPMSRGADPETINNCCKPIELNEIEAGSSCPICMIEYSKDKAPAVKTECGHIFHRQCMVNWLKVGHTCPMCRKEFPTPRRAE